MATGEGEVRGGRKGKSGKNERIPAKNAVTVKNVTEYVRAACPPRRACGRHVPRLYREALLALFASRLVSAVTGDTFSTATGGGRESTAPV